MSDNAQSSAKASDIVPGKHKTTRELELESKIKKLPDGVDAQQADLDQALILLQEIADNRGVTPQSLIEKLAGYLNRDVGRKTVKGAVNAGTEKHMYKIATVLGINANSIIGYRAAALLEAKYRTDVPNSEPSIKELADEAGVERATIRRWRGDDPKEDEARRRWRRGVWLTAVGFFGWDDPDKFFKKL